MLLLVPTARPRWLGVCYSSCPRLARGGLGYVNGRAHGSSGAVGGMLLAVPTARPGRVGVCYSSCPRLIRGGSPCVTGRPHGWSVVGIFVIASSVICHIHIHQIVI